VRRKNWLLLSALVASLTLFLSYGSASAYSVSGTPSAANGGLDFNGLLAPFENFIHSINSAGNTVPQISPPTSGGPFTQQISGGVQGGLQRFDAWFYGVAGFHVLNLFTAILNIFSWLLGFVKGIVDWLLSIVH